jgi:hypothetical protein
MVWFQRGSALEQVALQHSIWTTTVAAAAAGWLGYF